MILKNKEFREHTSGLFVSSDGEVFVPRTSNSKEHFTFGCINTYGYLVVRRNKKLYQVHRLVAECWIPNEENLPTVDHINRDKTNNNVENLRWADYSMQIQNRGKYTKPKNNVSLSKKVLQLTLDGELVREWPSTAECGRNGFNQSVVSACCRNCFNREGNNIYKGYIWKYKII